VFPSTNPDLGSGAYIAMSVVAAVLFFASLLLHELGHAVVARRAGMEIEGIVLWLFGGVARFSGLFPSARAELRIALAGPAVSLAIGISLVLAGALIPLPSEVDGVVSWLGTINLVLLVFNMLPALPLDGGRVLRSLIWEATGDFTRATRFAATLSQAFGQVMIAGGILLLILAGAPGGLWLSMIGWFLVIAARAESDMITLSSALRSMTVSDATASRLTVARAGMTVRQFITDVFERSRHAAYPVVDGDRVVGLLCFKDLARHSPDTTVREVARPLAETLLLAPDEDLGVAARELSQDRIGRALVLQGGELVGLLSMTDVSRLIELRSSAQGDRHRPGTPHPQTDS
jgi:Zn-dependent protease